MPQLEAIPARVRLRYRGTGPCWICDGTRLQRFHSAVLDFAAWQDQDPELAAYTGESIGIWRCLGCGFAQPDRIPDLPNYFGRMYDQRWSDDWVAREFDSTYKDVIFKRILDALNKRVRTTPRALLDIGSHAGRFLHLAAQAGWRAEGTEINQRTATFAAAKTGARVHRITAERVLDLGPHYHAVTLTDVLEHIPQPIAVLSAVRKILIEGGWIAVKVPCGPTQYLKETWRARLNARYRATLADNLVHVSHFSPRSLRDALQRAGFEQIAIEIGAPECPSGTGAFVRLALYNAGRLIPGAVHTPLALHLQAFARSAKH